MGYPEGTSEQTFNDDGQEVSFEAMIRRSTTNPFPDKVRITDDPFRGYSASARPRARHNISDVYYKFSLSLKPDATDVPGSVEITFALNQPSETLLDYRA